MVHQLLDLHVQDNTDMYLWWPSGYCGTVSILSQHCGRIIVRGVMSLGLSGESCVEKFTFLGPEEVVVLHR